MKVTAVILGAPKRVATTPQTPVMRVAQPTRLLVTFVLRVRTLVTAVATPPTFPQVFNLSEMVILAQLLAIFAGGYNVMVVAISLVEMIQAPVAPLDQTKHRLRRRQ